MYYLLAAAIGLILGAALTLLVTARDRKREARLAQQLIEAAQQEKVNELGAIITQLKESFAGLSREALSANTDDFLKLATTRLDKQSAVGAETLESKKKLIDSRLEDMSKRLAELQEALRQGERQRAELRGALTGQTQATQRLHETAAQLREALANPQRRGRWGERMAEDVLRLAGFRENVNYLKQHRTDAGSIPDFTFLLPNQQQLNMDVKFPAANYFKVLEAKDPATQGIHTQQFLRDVRQRVKEVTTRAYIDPTQGTVDYVLVFIPNEQIFTFIHEHDGNLLDEALRAKVVLCSPLTLYAILALIRQTAETFQLEQASRQILELLAGFRKQWQAYVTKMEQMGKRIEQASDEYAELVGVRTRQLERQLDKIDDLQQPGQQPQLPRQPSSVRPDGDAP